MRFSQEKQMTFMWQTSDMETIILWIDSILGGLQFADISPLKCTENQNEVKD